MPKVAVFASLAFLLLLAADNPLEGDKFLQKADEKFDQAATRAQEAYAKAMGEAYETKLKTYRGILAAATKAGDFDRASAVKAEIQEIEKQASDVGDVPADPKRNTRGQREEFDLLKVIPIESTSAHTQWKEDAIYVTSPGRLVYKVPTSAKRFRTTGTLVADGNVKLQVVVDDAVMLSTEEITLGKSVPIDVTIKPGAQRLSLVVDPNGPPTYDAVHWVRPRFDR